MGKPLLPASLPTSTTGWGGGLLSTTVLHLRLRACVTWVCFPGSLSSPTRRPSPRQLSSLPRGALPKRKLYSLPPSSQPSQPTTARCPPDTS